MFGQQGIKHVQCCLNLQEWGGWGGACTSPPSHTPKTLIIPLSPARGWILTRTGGC